MKKNKQILLFIVLSLIVFQSTCAEGFFSRAISTVTRAALNSSAFASTHAKALTVGCVDLYANVAANSIYQRWARYEDSARIRFLKGAACFGTAASLTALSYFGYEKLVAISNTGIGAIAALITKYPTMAPILGCGATVAFAFSAGRAIFRAVRENNFIMAQNIGQVQQQIAFAPAG